MVEYAYYILNLQCIAYTLRKNYRVGFQTETGIGQRQEKLLEWSSTTLCRRSSFAQVSENLKRCFLLYCLLEVGKHKTQERLGC